MTTLGDDYPNEQARIRRLIEIYKSLGPVGSFGAAMIEQVLQRADHAAANGDVVAMLRAYREMKDCQ